MQRRAAKPVAVAAVVTPAETATMVAATDDIVIETAAAQGGAVTSGGEALLGDRRGAPAAAGGEAEVERAAAECSAGVQGVVAGCTAPPAPAAGEGILSDEDKYFYEVPRSSIIMDRCFSLLEDLLYAEGVAEEREALVNANDVSVHCTTKSQCCFKLLQKLSYSGSAAGAGAILRRYAAESAAAATSAEAAEATAAAETTAEAAARARAGAAATGLTAWEGDPAAALVFLDTSPAVLGDILVAAALGVDTEHDLTKGRCGDVTTLFDSLRPQFADADWTLVAVCLVDWVVMVQNLPPTAVARVLLYNMACRLLTNVSNTALCGLGRQVGFSSNDPTCGNLQGLGEVSLVVPGVKGVTARMEAGVCGRCKAACYCSRECQRRHLKVHHAFCGPPLKQRQRRQKKEEGKQQ
jgi:hypothetical protein